GSLFGQTWLPTWGSTNDLLMVCSPVNNTRGRTRAHGTPSWESGIVRPPGVLGRMRKCDIMRPGGCNYFVALFGSLPSRAKNEPTCKKPQSPPDNQSVQVFLTASGKRDSPVTLTQSELSVSVDKQPAQVNALRAAKSDPLLFAVVVDTSRSDAGGAALIKKAALELFQGLATGGNQGYLVLV